MTDVAEINALHARAMQAASQAFQADLRGAYAAAESLFRQAFDAERSAAEKLAHDFFAEPSRSVLLRSAASLALDCREHREAERLVAIALSGSPPPEICEELRDLLERVYFGRHLALQGLELAPVEFQMSMAGNAVGFGVIESGQFLRRVETLDRLMLRTVERKRGNPFRETGGPPRSSMTDFQIYYSTARAASFAITVRLGRPQRQLLLDFPDQLQPAAVVDEVLTCLDDFGTGRADELRERIPDDAYLNNFTALAKKLAPDGDNIRTVGFTSKNGEVERAVALTSPPLDVWKPKLDERSREVFIGRILSADETSKTHNHPVLRVEDGKGTTSPAIRVPAGMLQDIVKPYWGELVRVVATKPRRGPLQMVEIQPVDQPSTEKT